jgi:plastocyanin
VLLAAMLIAGSAVAANPAARQPAKTHVVAIEAMRFSPQELTVQAGDRIVWENKDFVPHTATATDGGFDSRDLAAGKSWSFLATKTGTYTYECRFHPTMKGILTVR